MGRNRRLPRTLAATVVVALSCAPAAEAAPATNPLCLSDGTYRRAHPLICNTGSGPPGSFPGSGGGGGGLLDLIGDIVGGLTGGLL